MAKFDISVIDLPVGYKGFTLYWDAIPARYEGLQNKYAHLHVPSKWSWKYDFGKGIYSFAGEETVGLGLQDWTTANDVALCKYLRKYEMGGYGNISLSEFISILILSDLNSST